MDRGMYFNEKGLTILPPVADVHGSLEAIIGSIQGIPQHEVKVNIVLSGVGAVSDSDVDMASTTGGTLLLMKQKLRLSLSLTPNLFKSNDCCIQRPRRQKGHASNGTEQD